MKFFTKLPALALAAVFTSSIASATTYQFGSYATGAPTLGNQNTAMTFLPGMSQDPMAPGITPNTVTVAPGIWTGPIPNSTWISYGQTGPTTPEGSQPGGHFPPNGNYFFETTFTLDAQATAFSFSILADDTTVVFLDGTSSGNALVQPPPGGNVVCQTPTPNCENILTVTDKDVAGALPLLTAGSHTLIFQVEQLAGFDLGMDFSSTVTTGSPIPEPASLMLLGTGLMASAGALIRKRHAQYRSRQ